MCRTFPSRNTITLFQFQEEMLQFINDTLLQIELQIALSPGTPRNSIIFSLRLSSPSHLSQRGRSPPSTISRDSPAAVHWSQSPTQPHDFHHRIREQPPPHSPRHPCCAFASVPSCSLLFRSHQNHILFIITSYPKTLWNSLYPAHKDCCPFPILFR